MEKTSTSTLSGNYRHLSCIINRFILLFDYFLKSKNYLEIKQSLFLKKNTVTNFTLSDINLINLRLDKTDYYTYLASLMLPVIAAVVVVVVVIVVVLLKTY